MESQPFGSIEHHFLKITDPRSRNITHKLLDILVIAICGVICGADGWYEIEQYGLEKLTWLQQYLDLPHGIPSHDTFGRVFAQLDPEEFQASFMSWVKALTTLTQGQVIGLDGKQLRGSKDMPAGKQALYMVNAWAEANHLALGQRQVDGKSNEITAVPELLRLLDIQGCIVTLDAMGTQTKIAKAIRKRQADYVLAVKGNQGLLLEDLQMLFESDEQRAFVGAPYAYAREVKKGRARIDIRECWTTSDPAYLACLRTGSRWPDLQSIVMVRTQRLENNQVLSNEVRYFISSLPANAKTLLDAVRRHWAVENQLHWVLDVAFNEDASRVRTAHAPANLAVLRQMALNLLKKETTTKGGLKVKRKQAGWNNEYLLKVLLA